MRVHFYAAFTALSRGSFCAAEERKKALSTTIHSATYASENYRDPASVSDRGCDLEVTSAANNLTFMTSH